MLYIRLMKDKAPMPIGFRPTVEDDRLFQELCSKLGVNVPAIIRMGLRKLAESEGLNQGK